jgi:hypothetical protein
MGVGRVGVVGLTAVLLGLGGAPAVATPATTGARPVVTPAGTVTTVAEPGAAKPKKKKHRHSPKKPKHGGTKSAKPKSAKPKPGTPKPGIGTPKNKSAKPKHKSTKNNAANGQATKGQSANGTGKKPKDNTKLPPPVVLTGPALMLATGIAALKGTGYDVDVTAGHDSNTVLTEHGSVDPTANAADIDATGTTDGHPVHTDVRQIGNRLWALVNLDSMQSTVGGDPRKWMLIDRGQLNDPDDTLVNLSGNTDPLDIAGLMRKVSGLDQASPTRVSGIVDLTASTGVSAPTPEQLSFAGDVAATTPFTAAVDDHGRLVELRIEADAISPDLSRTYTFSRFGTPAPVTAPPAGQVMDAPDSAYQYFNGR